MQQDPVHRPAPPNAPPMEGQGRRCRQDQRGGRGPTWPDSGRRARGPRSGLRGHQFEAIRGPGHVSEPPALQEASRASGGGVRVRQLGPTRHPLRRVGVRRDPPIRVQKRLVEL